MASEEVILRNLEITLGKEMNKGEPFTSVEELKNLEKSLADVRGAVAALERDDGEVRSSLGTLVTLLHQVDDLLDEILSRRTRLPREAAHEDGSLGGNLGRALKRVVNSSNRVAEKVSLFFPSSNLAASPSSMAKQFHELCHKLGKVGGHLNEKHSNPGERREFQISRSYALTKYKVIGRDDDKKNIKKMLLEQRADETSFSIIPIIGSSGLGKSALAQFVYDDEEVKSHFDLRMWIQVSGLSNEADIIREIAESCTIRRSNYRRNPKPAKSMHSHVHQNGMNFDFLGCHSFHSSGTTPNHRASKHESHTYGGRLVKETERRLKKEIEGKLFLLVLDDACITHGQKLKDLFAAGARGSRILLTSSLSEVADFAKPGIVEPYKLKILPKQSSWILFDTFASKDPKLQQIGREIAGNCGGIPLTVKVAAGYLYGKSEGQWRSFNEELFTTRDEQIMMHVLHTCYNDLPTRMKACFVYCSLFPNDFDFNKHDLISLWIAQGFISAEHDLSLEDAAETYFIELLRRCFFEGVITDDLGNIVTCKMHHKMSNLARQHAAGVMRIMTDSRVNLDSTCKHLSFTWDRDSSEKISSSAQQVQHLRTLISVKVPDSNTKTESLEMISRFNRLRVLDLHDLGIQELPVSIGNLIHLRFLDISQNDGLVTLPKSITELSNLQTLKVNSCTKLNKIPGDFGELVHLKRFEVDECDSLTCMPKGLEKLTQLETLSRFVVSQDCPKDMSSIRLKALKGLRNLRGRLAIELLGDWTINILEAQAELENKSELVELKIYWSKLVLNVDKSSYLPSEEEKLSYKKLLEQLQPTSNLKILSIEGYKGGDFPIWAGVHQLTTSLPYLVAVSIDGCDQCEHLPPFGKLQYLKRLTLRHMANVKYMEKESSLKSSAGSSEGAPASSPFDQFQKELMQDTSLFFNSLEELTLHNFYKLESWWGDEVLVTPDKEFPSFRHLSKLKLLNCPNLRSMPSFTKVSDLDLQNVNQILLENFAQKGSMDSNASIKYLKIRGCPNLRSFKTVREGLGILPCLQKLVIDKCHALSSLTSELSYLTSLKSLEISGCKELDLSEDGNEVEISNISSSTPWNSLNRLRHLTLRELPKMECLPKGLKRIQNLRSLGISACTALKELPHWIGGLTMLQHLRIESCQAVTRLPEGLKEIKSLLKVEIIECPELMERCREHTGEDWHKIRHAQIFLHKSWRYGLVSELGTSQSNTNIRGLTDIKYIVIPMI